MGFDYRANNGRCPPFLVGGLILLSILLVCNWWSFSSQNYELVKQIDILEEQMRLCSEDRDQCGNERAKLETNLGELKIQIDQQTKEHKNDIDRIEKDKSMCKIELTSLKNLDATKTESLNALRATIEEQKEHINVLNEQVKKLNLSKNEAAKSEAAKLGKVEDNNINEDMAIETTEVSKEDERDLLMGNPSVNT